MCLALCIGVLPLSAAAEEALPTVKIGSFGALENGFYVPLSKDESNQKYLLVKKADPAPATDYFSYKDGTVTVYGNVVLESGGPSVFEVSGGTLTITGGTGTSLTATSTGASPVYAVDADVILDGDLDFSAACGGGDVISLTAPSSFPGLESKATRSSFKTTKGYTGDINISHINPASPIFGGTATESIVDITTTGTVTIGKPGGKSLAFNSTILQVSISAKSIKSYGMIYAKTFKLTAEEDIVLEHEKTSSGAPLFNISDSTELSAKNSINITYTGTAPLYASYSSSGTGTSDFTVKNAKNLSIVTEATDAPTFYNTSINIIDCENVTLKAPGPNALLQDSLLNVTKSGKRGGTVLIEGGGKGIESTGETMYPISNKPIAIENYADVTLKNNDSDAPIICFIDGMIELPGISNCGTVKLVGNGTTSISCGVTFDSQGGSSVPSQLLSVNDKVTAPTEPTRSGYTFRGWYKEADCTNEWDFENDTVTAGIILYAKWQANPSSGGSAPSHSPTVTPTVGGTTEISNPSPGVGDTVTVIPKPDTDKRIEKITVTDKNGNRIEIKRSADGSFNFTQPTDEVTIEVTYGTKPSLTDINESSWYAEAVNFAVENGLMSGMSDTEFQPHSELSRGMFVTVLYNLAGNPSSEGFSFSDVADGRYFTEAVSWAAANGFVNGVGGGKFAPEAPITREQLIVMLWNFCGKPSSSAKLDSFTDEADISAWAQQAMAWAVENKIISGKGSGFLDPNGTATRAEAAAFLIRYLNG